jgi:protein SCO1
MSMRTRYIRRLLPFVMLGVFLLGTTPAWAQDEPQPEELLATARFDQRLDEQVPLDLRFRDETGNEVELASLFTGKPVVLAMMYYNCPNICSIAVEDAIEKMRDVSFNMGTDYDVITVSIDPSETPAMAAEKKIDYVKHYNRGGAEEGWHALTGDEAMIKRLAAAIGFNYAWDDNLEQFAHPSGVVLLTAQGKISQYFYALVYKATDLRLGLVQASENKIGSLVDKILMRCYQFDPLTGQYTPIVMNIVRIVSVFITLVLGGFLAWTLYRERRNRAPVPGT